MDHATDNIFFGEANEISFKKCGTSIHEGGSAGYSIGLAVADMSHLQYTFGKGYEFILTLIFVISSQRLL